MILPIGLFGSGRRKSFFETDLTPTPLPRKKEAHPMSREFPKNPETPKVAEPTIGRIVYVFDKVGRSPDTLRPVPAGKPLAAIVADVLAPGSLTINAGVFNHDGTTGPLGGVPHISEGYEYNNRGAQYVWDWMPFQKGQASKTEELERRLKGAIGGPTTGMSGQNKVDERDRDSRERYDYDKAQELGKQQAGAPSPDDGKR